MVLVWQCISQLCIQGGKHVIAAMSEALLALLNLISIWLIKYCNTFEFNIFKDENMVTHTTIEEQLYRQLSVEQCVFEFIYFVSSVSFFFIFMFLVLYCRTLRHFIMIRENHQKRYAANAMAIVKCVHMYTDIAHRIIAPIVYLSCGRYMSKKQGYSPFTYYVARNDVVVHKLLHNLVKLFQFILKNTSLIPVDVLYVRLGQVIYE